MATEVPVVRHFIACREVVAPVGPHEVTIRGLVQAIVGLPGESCPFIQSIALYAVLTNGRGEHDFALQLTFLDRGETGTEAEEHILVTSPPLRLDLGQDPTRVHGLPYYQVRMCFDAPGQYTMYLLCDGEQLAHEYLEVRVIS